MAIEIPEAYQAAALVTPVPNDQLDPLFPTPLISSRSFQAYDPTSDADGGSSFENVRGGFTYVDVGSYIMKTTEGNDLLNAAIFTTPGSPGFDIIAAYLPSAIGGLPPTINDGFSIAIQAENRDGDADDATYWINVFRFNTEDTSAVLEP